MVKFPVRAAAPAAKPATPAPAPKAAPAAPAAKPAVARPASAPRPAARPAKPARSKYADVSTAKVSVEGNYIRPGRYIVQLTNVEEGTTQTSREDFVSIHMAILAADDGQLTTLDQRMGGGINAVGEDVSDFNKLSNIAFNQKMMAFAMVAANMTQEQIQEAEEHQGQFVEEMVSEAQPLAGRFLEVNVRMVKNKDNKNVPDDQVARDGCYGKVTYVRLIPASEIAELVDAEVLASRVPNLQELIDAEAAAGTEEGTEAA